MYALLLAFPLLVALPALGQSFPQSLRDYLQLTTAQIDSIGKLNLAYDQYVASKLPRLADLRVDITKCTAAEPLEPLALGQDYVEIEAIQRDLQDQNTQLLADNAKVLTDAQRVGIKALDDARALQPIWSDAICQNLLGRSQGAIIPVVRITPIEVIISSYCFVGNTTAALATYLGLSPAQLDTINQLNLRYVQFTNDKQSRIAQVRASLADLTAAAVLDPVAIGGGYAEIEAVTRDLRDKATDLRTSVPKLLTPPQTARIMALNDLVTLSPVSAAVCESLLAPSVAASPDLRWFNAAAFGPPYGGGRSCY